MYLNGEQVSVVEYEKHLGKLGQQIFMIEVLSVM